MVKCFTLHELVRVSFVPQLFKFYEKLLKTYFWQKCSVLLNSVFFGFFFFCKSKILMEGKNGTFSHELGHHLHEVDKIHCNYNLFNKCNFTTLVLTWNNCLNSITDIHDMIISHYSMDKCIVRSELNIFFCCIKKLKIDIIEIIYYTADEQHRPVRLTLNF